MAERDILAAVRLALGREPDLVLWRLSAGITRDPLTGRSYRAGLVPGAADLIGVLAPHGRLFALEVKTATGRISPEQKLWASLVRDHGGFVATIRSVEDAHAALARARDGECA